MNNPEIIPFLFDYLFNDDIEQLLFSSTPTTECIPASLLALVKKSIRPRLNCFVDEEVPKLSLDDFKSTFRVSRSMYEVLRNRLVPILSQHAMSKRNTTGCRKPLSIDTTLLSVLYYLGGREPLRQIASKFNMSEYSLMRSRERVIAAVLATKKEIIKWPQGSRIKEVIDGFYMNHGLHAVGAINCCHIAIRPPNEDPESYLNKRRVHSVILQAICDHDYYFTDIYSGWPGSAANEKVFENSPIRHELDSNPQSYCPDQSFLVGNCSFPLKSYLMTPFPDCQSHKYITYNTNHQEARGTIDHALHLLNSQWRRLKHVDIIDMHNIIDLVMMTCVLHNLCLSNEEDLMFFLSNTDDIHPEADLESLDLSPEGVLRREAIIDDQDGLPLYM